jgi:uncharacterized membrane protein
MTSTIVSLYLSALAVFTLMDLAWLGYIARGMYIAEIGPLMRTPVLWGAAVTFYFMFIAGLVFFAAYPAYMAGSVVKGLLLGALVGFFVYASYDLTNLATLSGWTVKVAVIDMLWGAVIGGVSSAAAVAITLKIMGGN